MPPTDRQQWSHWYKRATWLRLRRAQLKRQPLCRMCLDAGPVKAAKVVDHIKQHKGDVRLFTDPNNLQSLCKHHHDAVKQREERTGYVREHSNEVGIDGLPIDPRHPFYTLGGRSRQ